MQPKTEMGGKLHCLMLWFVKTAFLVSMIGQSWTDLLYLVGEIAMHRGSTASEQTAPGVSSN